MENSIDDIIIRQLAALAQACQKRNIKPIICGGLGVYLRFCGKEEIREIRRATQDIDLMFSRQDLLEEAKRTAMAEMITGELQYIVQEDKKYHGFRKDPNQKLDILVPPIKELEQNNYRLRIVKSVLHGHITEEAEYIDEGLQVICLPDTFNEFPIEDNVNVYLPCPANLMIMKLYAFRDRIEGDRKDMDRAMAHAFDVFITVMLTDRDDLKQGQEFSYRHKNSDIIRQTKSIIEDSFSHYEKIGWQTVLSSPNFYPTISIKERQKKLQQASARLARWFNF